jgi:hypothetical protein
MSAQPSHFGAASLGCGVRPAAVRRERAPAIAAQPRFLASNNTRGYGAILAALRFGAWAHEQRHFPTPEAVMAEFGVSRASAYRWCSALAEAYGFRLEPREKCGADRRMRLVREEAR